MKKMFVVAMTVIAAFAFQSAFAQAPAKTDAEKAAAKAKQEQIMQTRLQLLKDELKLDDAQFAKVCERIERLLQEDIDNGYAVAEEKLKQFKDNPKLWLKSNFNVNTWRHEAAPRWDKWITTP